MEMKWKLLKRGLNTRLAFDDRYDGSGMGVRASELANEWLAESLSDRIAATDETGSER